MAGSRSNSSRRRSRRITETIPSTSQASSISTPPPNRTLRSRYAETISRDSSSEDEEDIEDSIKLSKPFQVVIHNPAKQNTLDLKSSSAPKSTKMDSLKPRGRGRVREQTSESYGDENRKNLASTAAIKSGLKRRLSPTLRTSSSKRRVTNRISPGESSSVSSISGDLSRAYTTPGTSTFNSPTTIAALKRRIEPKSNPYTTSISTTDEQLARRLQAEEYGDVSEGQDLAETSPESGPTRRSGRKSRPNYVVDSVGEDDEDDEFNMESSDSDVPLVALSNSNVKVKVGKTRLPTRSTRPRYAFGRDRPPGFRLGGRMLATTGGVFTEIGNITRAESTEALTSNPTSLGPSDLSGSDLSEPDSDIDDDQLAPASAARLAAHGLHNPHPGVRNRAARERRKLEKSHPEIKTMWDDLAATPVIKPDRIKQPEYISRELKPFQLEGVDWMMKQEKTKWKGGLLGDEMGMGKTIQAVSLIMSDYPQKSPTLVLVPPVALMQWQNEIGLYTSDKLKVLVYHGASVKKIDAKNLKKYDVVMMSYSGLESMYRKEQKGFRRVDEEGVPIIKKEDSLMHEIIWHRIILDEAHSIKSRTSGTAKACFALKSTYKWCLSGTPLQNRIGELFSLLRFLEVQPFACYFCKNCSCSSLHWSLEGATRACRECNHGGFSHVSVFNQELLDPIQKYGNIGEGKAAFAKLRLLTDRIMLRRIKRDHTSAMELPPKDVRIHNEFFGEAEQDFATSIMSQTKRKFNTYVAQGVMLNNYANIFGLIMFMRQVADHPDLITKKNAEGGANALVCRICEEVAEDAIRSRCHHDFCRRCVKVFLDNAGEHADCPRCHIQLSIDLEQPEMEQDESAVKKNSIVNRIDMSKWISSTKIEELICELYELRHPRKTSKSIVFSQFTSMLQLVEWRLRRAGFKTVMLDGSMTPSQRQASIEFFMTNYDVEVFLVSLKAGGVALNLTEASKVFIVDPWWNPAAEWQSADRCHRIGQQRPCEITRLVIEDSVESRMVLLQEKKANMIRSTINGDTAAMENLSPEDMQFLFRGT